MQALFTLTSSESKRLLGKAVAALPEVQQAKDNGYLVVSRGSTNAFIIEELHEKQNRQGEICRRPDHQRDSMRLGSGPEK